MKIIVIGKGGQLVSEFEQLKGKNPRWTYLIAKELGVIDILAVEDYFGKQIFDYIDIKVKLNVLS